MHSYRNPMHEQAAKAMAEELIQKAHRKIPVFTSSELWGSGGTWPG